MAPSATSSVTENASRKDSPGSVPLWQIVDVPGKGKGITVTRDITPGTLLLSEAPILTTETITSTTIPEIEADLALALSKSSPSDQAAVRSLHNNFPEESNQQLYGIIRSNAYPLGPGAETGGLFIDIARINHSCAPNTVQYWNELLGKQTIHAVRPIKEGEEITTAYHVGGTSAERKKVLKELFRFDCKCTLCSLPASSLQDSDSRIILAEKLDAVIGDSKKVYFSPEEVMDSGRELFYLFEKDGIKDGRLSRLYYDLFQMCNLHGDLARARCFAKYYVDAKKLAEGEESLNVLEMGRYVKNPEKHDSYEPNGKWKSAAKDVPRGLKVVAFARWLWREDV